MVRLGEAAGIRRPSSNRSWARIAQHIRETGGQTDDALHASVSSRIPGGSAPASIVFAALIGAALILVGRGNRYAFAQTVEAQRNVRSRSTSRLESGAGIKRARSGAFSYRQDSGTTEVWIEVGEDGKPVRLRADTAWSGDGPYIVLWHRDKASVWLMSKNVFWQLQGHGRGQQNSERDHGSELRGDGAGGARGGGKAQITQVKRTRESPFAPKVLVVNPPEPEGTVEVYVIDPKTKLLQEYEKYTKHGSELVFAARFRFTEYNEPIPDSIFAPALTADVTRLDQSNRDLGVAQGKMTDSEVCEAAVRQFFECLIAKDYGKAADIWPGWGPDALKERNALSSVAKIISIGPAKPDARPRTEENLRSL